MTKKKGSVIVGLTFKDLHKLLNLPPAVTISHAQVRSLAPELYLRLNGPDFPPIEPAAFGKIVPARLEIRAAGQPGIHWEKEEK